MSIKLNTISKSKKNMVLRAYTNNNGTPKFNYITKEEADKHMKPRHKRFDKFKKNKKPKTPKKPKKPKTPKKPKKTKKNKKNASKRYTKYKGGM
jgi:hypothetical protein